MPHQEETDATKPEWLSTDKAAKRLGVTARTLYRFIDDGGLPAYRFGRVIRVKQTDVDGYIANCRIKPGELDHLHTPLTEHPLAAAPAQATRPD